MEKKIWKIWKRKEKKRKEKKRGKKTERYTNYRADNVMIYVILRPLSNRSNTLTKGRKKN
jgi:hypothetical protein